MDQQAFRDLLSSSSASKSSISSSSSSSKGRVFGAPQKRSAGVFSSTTSSADLFAPRKKSSKDATKSTPRGPSKNSITGEKYLDRAKARRVGKEDEDSSDLTRLADEWKSRWSAAQTEEERREIEKQMAFLGGDARHSILVKGLDHSLLAQQKAKDAGTIEELDEDLERVYDDTVAAKAMTSPSAGGSVERGSPSGEKRSRESVIEALKRRNLTKGEASTSPSLLLQQDRSSSIQEESHQRQLAEDAEFEKAQRLGKFKPISASNGGGGFKPVGRDEGDVIITKDGKRLRKKRKKLPEQEGEQQGPTVTREGKNNQITETTSPAKEDTAASALPPRLDPQPSARRDDTEVSVQQPVQESTLPPPAATLAIPQHSAPSKVEEESANDDDDDDEDDDIFAEAGRWQGLSEDDSEDEQGEKQMPTDGTKDAESSSQSVNVIQRKDWFAEGDGKKLVSGDASSSSDIAPLPTQLNRLISSIQTGSSSSNNPLPNDPEEESQGRLQGLSTSSLPSNVSKMLLEAEEEEARRLEEKEKGWWKKKKKERKRKNGEGLEDVEDQSVQKGS